MPGVSLAACHQCDQVYRIAPLAAGSSARCPRCGAVLYRRTVNSIDRTLALTLAGIVLFAVSNAFPFLTFDMQGQAAQTTLLTGVVQLYRQGLWELALLVAFTTVIAPALQLLLLAYVFGALKLGLRPADLGLAMRALCAVSPWGMLEVFMLGILVSVVKIAAMATVVPGLALWSFALLVVVLAWAMSSMEPERVWERVRWSSPGAERPVAGVSASAGAHGHGVTRAGCHSCGLLSAVSRDPSGGHSHAHCPRCGAVLHVRKPSSISRTWALLLAAYVLYIPANVLPIMDVSALGSDQADTIMSGVIFLAHHGDWPLALLIFFASIFVPGAKLLMLTYLTVSVQLGSARRPRERARMYRLVEGIGRWSMVDIYVVTILVALVQMGGLATITARWGAVFFGAVVVITIFAAEAFDPRLIWDKAERADER